MVVHNVSSFNAPALRARDTRLIYRHDEVSIGFNLI